MRRLSPALLLLTLMFAASAHATTMVELSEEELTYVADLIVEAEVEVVESERGSGSVWINSVATLRLTRVLKGEGIEGDRVLVREWGGTINGETTRVQSSPAYSPGERVLVFLEADRSPDQMWRTLGMSQGKFTLVEEQDTGRDVLLPHVEPSQVAFDEAAVPLPAVRRYSDAVVNAVLEQTDAGFVPNYTRIPGLPQEKDDRFRADAEEAGQAVDPRWDVARAKMVSISQGGE